MRYGPPGRFDPFALSLVRPARRKIKASLYVFDIGRFALDKDGPETLSPRGLTRSSAARERI